MSIKNDFAFNENVMTHIPTRKTLFIPTAAIGFVTGNMAVDIEVEKLGITSAQVFEYACQYVKTWRNLRFNPVFKSEHTWRA